MDITCEFLQIATKLIELDIGREISENKDVCSNPFLLKATELNKQISSFKDNLERNFDDYVDYHRYLPARYKNQAIQTFMRDDERSNLQQNITSSIASFASEVNTLNRVLKSTYMILNKSTLDHYHEIVNFLSEKLQHATKLSRKLKRESDNLNVNPFRLTTQYEEFRNILPSTINYQETGKDEINSQSKQSNEIKASKKETKEENVKLPSSFADRYSDEIASTSKIKQYQLFGSKFKTELLKEAKELQHQHKQELQEAEKIERIVTNVSDMITEFVYLLQSQTDSVDNIHDAAVYATEYVKDADVELQKTIDRSKSHSRNMVVLIIVLSFLLLILDYFTP